MYEKKNSLHIHVLLVLGTLFTCAQCKPKKAPEQNAIMTIFIHGTIMPVEVSLSGIVKIVHDKIDNTLYGRAASYIRNDPYFYYGHAIQELGFRKVDLRQEPITNGAQVLAKLYEYQYNHYETKPLKHLFYTFGWNGLLSATHRYEAAEVLYEELINELEILKKQKIYPFIRIVTYSHGGNVALYLPAVIKQGPFELYSELTIDELVAIAMPIQRETDFLVTSPMFKKVYNIYSTEDSAQTLDMFSSQQFFSKRLFTNRAGFMLPEKLQQIQFRVTQEIKWKYTVKELSEPYKIIEQKSVRLVHKDPGHTEMWRFNWASYWYRDNFPLNPLPVAALVPTIIHSITTYQPDKKNLIFDICPREGAILLRQHRSSFRQAVPFLTPEKQKGLWELAEKNRPPICTYQKEVEHLEIALKKAKTDLLEIKKYKRPRSRTLAFDNSKKFSAMKHAIKSV